LIFIDILLCLKSPVEVVGLRQVFREADFPRKVLVDNDVILLLHLQFVVPRKDTDGLHEREGLNKSKCGDLVNFM